MPAYVDTCMRLLPKVYLIIAVHFTRILNHPQMLLRSLVTPANAQKPVQFSGSKGNKPQLIP